MTTSSPTMGGFFAEEDAGEDSSIATRHVDAFSMRCARSKRPNCRSCVSLMTSEDERERGREEGGNGASAAR